MHTCTRTMLAVPLPCGLPLTQELLCGYLEDSPCLMAQELLVMFYLTHHRYAEAVALQEKIRPLAKVTPIPACHNFLAHYCVSEMSYIPSSSFPPPSFLPPSLSSSLPSG